MGHGFRSLSYYESGLSSLLILRIYVLLTVGVFILFLIFEYLKKSNPHYKVLMEAVNNRYANGEIQKGDYLEIKYVLDEEFSKDTAVTELNLQFAKGNISLEDYYKKLNNITLRS